MIDTTAIPANLYDASLPLPNVYFVTVNHVTSAPQTLYIAADSSGAAVQKVRRHFREHHHLALYRGNCDIKLRRFRLGDYLECPQGLQEAGEAAAMAHERDTVAKLATRQKEVQELVADLTTRQKEPASTDWAQIEQELAEQLRQVG